MFDRFRRIKQDVCKVLLINETSREIRLQKAKTKKGQIHYKDMVWLVQTDPLFMDGQAVYIVSDKRIPSFSVELEPKEKMQKKNKESNPSEEQKSVKFELINPMALKKAVTSEFFEALMSPIHWSRGDWIKALGIGFAFYVMVKWVLLSVFKVPLP